MTLPLQSTIWVALLCFAIGESGRAFTDAGRKPPMWAWRTFTIGLLFAVAHTVIAFDTVHNWNHAAAVSNTAAQTHAVFGAAFGAGIYVNYLFFGVWLADAVWWRLTPDGYVRPRTVTWTFRAFYMLVIFNGAVVFVDGLRRIFGLVIVSWLARVWSPGVRGRRVSHGGAE